MIATSGARVFNSALILDALRGVKGSMELKASEWVQRVKDQNIVDRFQKLAAVAAQMAQ